MNDTSPEVEAVRMSIFRAMPTERKLAMAFGWSRVLRDLTREGIRKQFPGASDAKIERLLVDRCLGPELAAKAYGPLSQYG